MLKNFIALIYAIAVVTIGGVFLFATAATIQKIVDSAAPPDPDVIQFLQGEW